MCRSIQFCSDHYVVMRPEQDWFYAISVPSLCLYLSMNKVSIMVHSPPLDYWLECKIFHVSSQLQPEFIREVQILLKVLFMFIPAPLFWALSDQQGSRWTLQAEKLNGDLVWYNFILLGINYIIFSLNNLCIL